MRAEHLKYFLALAENHSITKTSLEFYTTHQSVSKIIRQPEEEMEAQLFVRSSKGMTLTPEGEVLLPVARETVKAFQQVRLELAHMTRQKDLEGELLLWGTPISNAVAMPSLLSDFSALYPKVRYQIKEANTLTACNMSRCTTMAWRWWSSCTTKRIGKSSRHTSIRCGSNLL